MPLSSKLTTSRCLHPLLEVPQVVEMDPWMCGMSLSLCNSDINHRSISSWIWVYMPPAMSSVMSCLTCRFTRPSSHLSCHATCATCHIMTPHSWYVLIWVYMPERYMCCPLLADQRITAATGITSLLHCEPTGVEVVFFFFLIVWLIKGGHVRQPPKCPSALCLYVMGYTFHVVSPGPLAMLCHLPCHSIGHIIPFVLPAIWCHLFDPCCVTCHIMPHAIPCHLSRTACHAMPTVMSYHMPRHVTCATCHITTPSMRITWATCHVMPPVPPNMLCLRQCHATCNFVSPVHLPHLPCHAPDMSCNLWHLPCHSTFHAVPMSYKHPSIRQPYHPPTWQALTPYMSCHYLTIHPPIHDTLILCTWNKI